MNGTVPAPGSHPEARRSPNIWDSPAVYEIENRAVDPDGRLLAAPVDMGWRFTSRADLESAVRIELAADQADRIIAGHPGWRSTTRSTCGGARTECTADGRARVWCAELSVPSSRFWT